MIEIGINQISKNFGFKNVFSAISFEIETRERAALVGRNGTGKTTILRIIAGIESADSGGVSIRRGATIGYLEQIPSLTAQAETVRDVLMESFEELAQIERRMRDLESRMAQERDAEALEIVIKQYDSAQNRYATLGGYEIEERFGKVVSGFGLSELLDRPFNVLSGGQKTIVKLAAVVLRQPEILLLDEPTNHLDVRALEWFEDYLSKYAGTVIIVSHDRYFLDRVATKTILLEKAECRMYMGNYSFSIAERERQLLIEFEQYKNQQKKIDAMKAAIKRYRTWAAQSDNEDLYRKAKELEKRLEKMEVLERPQMEKPVLPMKFAGSRTGKEVLRIEDFHLAFGDLTLFDHASATIYEKEKVCLMGGNGTGKTSLIRAVLSEITEYTGRLVVAPAAKIGYIPQEIRFKEGTDTALDAFRAEYICSEGEGRNMLAKFFFYGDHVFKRVSALSGGEKVLLKLAALIQHQVNFLILDEPTNHIDIRMRELLEEALLDYAGTLLFISHDRYFIGKIAGRVIEIEDKGFVNYGCGYEEYRKLKR